MSNALIENPVTGERAILRRAPTPKEPLLIADLYARPGARVVGEHVHPTSVEAFTVVRGRLGVRLDGAERLAGPGTRIVVRPGSPHDWWNAGDDTAWVIVEVDPGERFQYMVANLFGLAADGQTDDTGRPSLLQTALLAREFDDTVRFTSPPRTIQRPLFAALAPIARLRGLKPRYARYEDRTGPTIDDLEPIPPTIAALIPALASDDDQPDAPANPARQLPGRQRTVDLTRTRDDSIHD